MNEGREVLGAWSGDGEDGQSSQEFEIQWILMLWGEARTELIVLKNF
jgi:hypothetical protein